MVKKVLDFREEERECERLKKTALLMTYEDWYGGFPVFSFYAITQDGALLSFNDGDDRYDRDYPPTEKSAPCIRTIYQLNKAQLQRVKNIIKKSEVFNNKHDEYELLDWTCAIYANLENKHYKLIGNAYYYEKIRQFIKKLELVRQRKKKKEEFSKKIDRGYLALYSLINIRVAYNDLETNTDYFEHVAILPNGYLVKMSEKLNYVDPAESKIKITHLSKDKILKTREFIEREKLMTIRSAKKHSKLNYQVYVNVGNKHKIMPDLMNGRRLEKVIKFMVENVRYSMHSYEEIMSSLMKKAKRGKL